MGTLHISILEVMDVNFKYWCVASKAAAIAVQKAHEPLIQAGDKHPSTGTCGYSLSLGLYWSAHPDLYRSVQLHRQWTTNMEQSAR